MDCFNCGQGMTCTPETYHYKECGIDNVYLKKVDVCRCKKCGESIAFIPALPQLNSVIGEMIIEKESLLGGDEIRFLRKNIGLKAIELQGYLGVTNATISRWEQGKQPISPGHDRLLRMFYAVYKGIDYAKTTALARDLLNQISQEVVSAPAPYMIDPSAWSDGCVLPAT